MKNFKIISIVLLFTSLVSCNLIAQKNIDIKNKNSKANIKLQILGSGGPEFSKRASSAYLIWIDNKAKVMIDAGAGAFANFTKSGAKIKDLDVIALSHLHIDHSADIPAFMKAGYFSDRKEKLPLLGPKASGDFPNVKEFLNRLFGHQGAFAYMQDILTKQSDSFEIEPIILGEKLQEKSFGEIKIRSIGVNHGRVPALAFSIELRGKKIVFAGDTNANSQNLILLAKNADYLIVHHAIPENAGKYAKKLHITPTRIGEVAQKAQVKHLILSHRMLRTYHSEKESLKLIQKHYQGPVIWAEDMMSFEL